MRRFFLLYSRVFLLPLLAAGLILTGCDSTGPNGETGNDDPQTFEYPSNDYGAQTVANLLAFDLGVRTGSEERVADNSESDLDALYAGNIDDATIPSIDGSPEQSVYGDFDFDGSVNLSMLTSDTPLLRSENLESGDSPSPGSQITTDQMLEYYFERAGSENVTTTDNGIVLSQFAEKMLLGTPIYGRGAAILSDFASGSVTSDEAEQWDAAFGYFGFPRTLEPFLNYSGGGEGLAGGPAQDIDGNGSVDLTSEYVYTWAAYAIERSTAAANTDGPSPDFARDAFNALVEGREDIENGEDPSDHARTALDAWEKVVAINVIHYINSMEGSLDEISDDTRDVQEGDIDEGAWGEAKAFAWNLQFYNSELSDTQLTDILEDVGNDPPYNEGVSVSDYETDLADATQILQNAYGFSDTNVAAW